MSAQNNNNDAEPPIPVRRSSRVRDLLPEFPYGMPDTPRRSRSALVAVTETIVDPIVAVAPEPIRGLNRFDIIKEDDNDHDDDRKPPAVVKFANNEANTASTTSVFEPVIAKDSSTVITSTAFNENKENDDNNKLPAATISDKANTATTFVSDPIITEKSTLEITSAAPTHTNLAMEEECTATFEPIVQLEEVEVNTVEEEEEVLCSYRSKLFLFGETLLDKGTGNKTWKERGIGEACILRHRDHRRIRFLMRQEKTMKVISNHALDPRIVLEPNAGSDRSWVWSCFDVADGTLEEKAFALRFSNSELAEQFKAKYQECQAEMAQLLAKKDARNQAEEVTKAFAGLSTKDE